MLKGFRVDMTNRSHHLRTSSPWACELHHHRFVKEGSDLMMLRCTINTLRKEKRERCETFIFILDGGQSWYPPEIAVFSQFTNKQRHN